MHSRYYRKNKHRTEVLPSIIQDWENISLIEKDQISTLNNFFCGMHVLVRMADTTSKTWDTHFEGPVGAAATVITVSKSDSGIVVVWSLPNITISHLVPTTGKAMCKHGSEQSGVFQPS